MKARQLLSQSSFGPQQLEAIYKAFDDAWEKVAPQVSTRAEAVEAARMKLAEIVLSLAASGVLEASALGDTAVERMHAAPTLLWRSATQVGDGVPLAKKLS